MTQRTAKRVTVFRPGAAILECAIVLPIAFFILFSLLDLGLATIRYNALAEASRRVAREAIIHGSLAPAVSGTWGPGEFVGLAADNSPLTESLVGMLPTMAPDNVAVTITWPDGDNSPRDRVLVELTYEHQSLIPFLAAWGAIDLRAAATMHIVN